MKEQIRYRKKYLNRVHPRHIGFDDVLREMVEAYDLFDHLLEMYGWETVKALVEGKAEVKVTDGYNKDIERN